MNKFILYFIISICLIATSCKNKSTHSYLPELIEHSSATESSVELKTSTIQDWLKLKIDKAQKDSASNITTEVEPNLFATVPIIEVYHQNEFEPLWVNENGLNKNGEELLKVLTKTEQYGLLKNYYGAENISSAVQLLLKKNENLETLADIELSLTNAWLLFALHLHEGAIYQDQMLNKDFGNQIDFYVQTLLKSLKKNRIKTTLEELQPQDFQYKNLQSVLVQLSTSKNKLPKGFSIPDHKSDSVACANKVIEALKYHGRLDTSEVNHQKYISTLKQFQLDHGLEADGIPGPNTRTLLLLDNEEKYKRIAINLDKWRGQKYQFPEEYLFVNVPAFELYWIKNNEVIEKHRVIVGKPGSSTPDIISEIYLVVINPDWTVPQSIIRGELRHKSSGYLSKYNIFQNGNKVSPGAVRWNSGSIRVVQPPGPSNALGNIKFLFKNNHSVYLHDTPSRNLFSNSVRAYSHGCIRVQNPLELGQNLLKRDGMELSLDSINCIIDTRKTNNISLKNKMPIYIQYYTSAAKSTTQAVFYPDLYNRQEKLAAVLFYGKYNQKANVNQAKKELPSIKAKPQAIELPKDSLSLQSTP
ncbi:MAG TPA: L,D-transpeptidase family protein [Chitinophagales bacterium]|nr:L,D-transpeptidase family protein [Chitinophagales bacterium]